MIWLCALPLLAACSAPSSSDNPAPGTASPEGTLVVSWQPSRKNTDGTPLTDLSGYTIYYGTKPGDYSQKQTIDDPSATHAVIRGLKPGVHYYVAISANNRAGRQSELSTAKHR
jgi:fibronectin type III domain protein